jgi:hypothetical protein
MYIYTYLYTQDIDGSRGNNVAIQGDGVSPRNG